MALLDRAIARLLPVVPRPVVRQIASRYIAGATLADAVDVVHALNGARKLATIDVLGEAITSAAEASAIVRSYQDVFAEIERERLDANVSVKLTALGLKLGYDLCRDNLDEVVLHANERGNFVRIDMEDSSTTSDTLGLYRELRAAGRENLGVVLQASLRRTLDDVAELAELQPSVRLCKGIYVEPEAIQFRDYEAVRANFVRALTALLDAGCQVGIATHDEWLIDAGERLVSERALGPEAYEFQLLLGVRQELGDALIERGHRVRIYVPFGEHWYAYSLRRLQENPKIAGYIAGDTLGRFLPGSANGR